MTTRQLCLKCGSPLPHLCTGTNDIYSICCGKLITKSSLSAHRRSKSCFKNKVTSQFQLIKLGKLCNISEVSVISDEQIIIVMRGKNAGSVFMYKEGMRLTEYFHKLDITSDVINNLYLYNILKWKKIQSDGGYVSLDVINEMDIPIPSIEKQIEIAAILDDLNKSIVYHKNEVSRLSNQFDTTVEDFVTWSIIPVINTNISCESVISNVLDALTHPCDDEM